jgi:hypothetical protein
MNASVLALTVWAIMGPALVLFSNQGSRVPRRALLARAGDSTLDRDSANWLVALAVSGALLVCFFLN